MKFCAVHLTILVVLNLSFQQSVTANPVQRHVVLMGDLQNELTVRSEERLRNIQEIRKLLRHEVVQREVGKLVNLEKVELALVALDDETLQELAIQSEQVNDQIEAGITMWGWIGIAILAAIAIIILVIIYGRDA